MAYSDYGAFVYCNGERRTDKEDVALFDTDEETFGMDSANIPSGARIFMNLLKMQQDGVDFEGNDSWITRHIHHGIMGDSDIRVMCHKQGLPYIYEMTEDGIKKIKYCDDDTDYFEYEDIVYEYKGYEFLFHSGKPYEAEMIEPDGTHWVCEYDYLYGAGFEDE